MSFTFEQIDEIHNQLGSADSLPEYARALNSIGVVSYDSFVTDGHSDFFGKDGFRVSSPSYHDSFVVAEQSDNALFQKYMKLAEAGKIGYEEMSKGFAESGIEKWTMDTEALTFAYSDKSGQTLLVEDLKK